PPVQAAGLRNLVDLTGRAVDRVGCYELVWANGVQLRMTFANLRFAGATPSERVDNFYVLAPQTDTPQGTAPSFPHDHVVGNVPVQNRGGYRVHLHAYFVLCSAEGIASGGCVPTMTTIQGLGTIPLARTVHAQMLTSVEPIESAADSGLIALVDTGGVIVSTINPGK
nr:hypothetical protein [Chloroflexota bacterium]